MSTSSNCTTWFTKKCQPFAFRGLMVGFLLLGMGCQDDAAPNPQGNRDSGKKAQLVKVQKPERKVLRTQTRQPVTLHAYYQAEIHAKVSGYLPLENLKVDIGQEVEAGKVLGIIDVPELQQRVDRQEAFIKKLQAEQTHAQAAVAVAKAGLEAAKAQLETAKAEVNKTKARVDADKQELDRVADLVKQESVAQRLEDEANYRHEASLSAKKAAEANVSSHAEDVEVSRARIDIADAGVTIAERQVEVARKELAELKTLRDYATLKAPFKGTVIERNVEPGNLVQKPGATSGRPSSLFVIADLSRIRARVSVPERDTPWLKVGAKATLDLLALQGQLIEGNVSRISGAIEEETRTMLVEIDLPNPRRRLSPGMFGKATIELQERSNCLVLPAPMVRYDNAGNSYVLIVDQKNQIQSIPVVTGLDDGQTIEIIKGLSGEERVVEPTARRLKVGQNVQIAK